jgi:radical SAM superfamily enzyme YgiQ (UPF0313 family)
MNPGQQIRFRSEAHIAAELDDIRDRSPHVNSIRVLDDLFLRNARFIERATRLFSERNLRWRAMAHIAGLAPATNRGFAALAASGCLELFVGIESGSEQRRLQIGKPPDLEPTIRVISSLLDAGIGVKAYVIFGLPGETEDEMLATYGLIERFATYAQRVQGNFRVSAFKFRPYHGTRLYNDLISSGHSWDGIHQDISLEAVKKQRPYDFVADNFSAVSTERLNELIAQTVRLNP